MGASESAALEDSEPGKDQFEVTFCCCPCYKSGEVVVSRHDAILSPYGNADTIALQPEPLGGKLAAEEPMLRLPQAAAKDATNSQQGQSDLGARVSCVMDGIAASPGGGLTPNISQENLFQQLEVSDDARVRTQTEEVNVEELMSRAQTCTKDASVSKDLPDFTGVWKMVRTEGDFDGFLKEMGVSWIFRKAAGGLGYGVNATFHSITQSEGRIRVETKNPKGTFLKDFVLDGSEQDDVDPMERQPIKVVPYWKGQVLVMEAWMPKPSNAPQKLPVTRRYMNGEEMVVEQISPKGIAALRFFVRQ
eukprot:TRINITY_DN11329_c0_g3_i1.p1 TRINITY_DN11329_c0_g3~~TRINITY_DN11329_c0_g3_i1.p1  ORF type:complete len:305 (+),score=65.45 TRINITY_DN11329_c0_g3_i1:64-978(+)